jgi:hypothetical protein
MRSLTSVVFLVALSGCAGRFAAEPAMEGWERAQALPGDKGSPAQYAGDPKIAAPVLPVMAFGTAYDVSLAMRSRHANWAMHEFGRVTTPSGDIWVALESRADTNDQVLVVDSRQPELWMPELPYERQSTEIMIEDLSNDEAVEVSLSYQNVDGELVELDYKGEPPYRVQELRNGDPMGRSANVSLSAWDVQHRESAFKATLSIGGSTQKMEKSGGFVPYQWTLEQASGGLAVAAYDLIEGDSVDWSNGPTQSLHRLEAEAAPAEAVVEDVSEEEEEGAAFSMDDDDFSMDEEEAADAEAPAADEEAPAADEESEESLGDEDLLEGFGDVADESLPVPPDANELLTVEYATPPVSDFTTAHYQKDGSHVEQQWQVHGANGRLIVDQVSDLRTLSYEFIVDEGWGAFELSNITVTQFGRGVPTTAVQFSPALPDLRKPFNGRMKSNFAIDINGQRSNVHGTVEAWWTETGPKMLVVPEGPEWSEGQDMLTEISYRVPGQASVRIKRIDSE